jgi:hypothetical protein
MRPWVALVIFLFKFFSVGFDGQNEHIMMDDDMMPNTKWVDHIHSNEHGQTLM